MGRTFGFSAAEERVTPSATKKVPNNTACNINCEKDTDQPLFRNIRVSLNSASFLLPRQRYSVIARLHACSLKIGRNSRNAFANDQAMDIMRAFIGVNRFEVVHVTHDAVIVDDS